MLADELLVTMTASIPTCIDIWSLTAWSRSLEWDAQGGQACANKDAPDWFVRRQQGFPLAHRHLRAVRQIQFMAVRRRTLNPQQSFENTNRGMGKGGAGRSSVSRRSS